MVFIKCARDQIVPKKKEKGFTTYNVIIFLETTKIHKHHTTFGPRKTLNPVKTGVCVLPDPFFNPKGSFLPIDFSNGKHSPSYGSTARPVCTQRLWSIPNVDVYHKHGTCAVGSLSQHVIAICFQNPTGS